MIVKSKKKLLIETNKILVEIQKQLASDFAMQVAEQKGDEQKEKKERSREKLKAEESALEKGRKKIGAALANTTKKVLSPFKGIFEQIKEFVLTVGAGIAVNAAFKWLSNEENRKKMEDAFSFIKENWKWIAGVAAALFLMGPIVGIISTIVYRFLLLLVLRQHWLLLLIKLKQTWQVERGLGKLIVHLGQCLKMEDLMKRENY